MPYSLDKEVSQDKGIAVNRNAITALDTRLTIAESTLADVDAHAIRDDITADQNMVGRLIITKDANPFRLEHTSSSSYVEAHLVNDLGQTLVLGSIGSTYGGVDWTGSTYIYNSGPKNMWIKSQQELGFFTGGLTLANKRLSIDAAGAATFTNDVTVNGTLSANGGSVLISGNVAWHAGNDGAGSGLDADLLDGVQGSNYLRKDVVNDVTARHRFNACEINNWDDMSTAPTSAGALEVYNVGAGNDAFMCFHAGGDYACYFGLDADTNELAVGGWSYGAVKHRIWHAGNTLCYSGQMGTAMTSPTAPTVLKFNEIWVNTGGITYDGATGKFTVPATGIYRVTINPFKITGGGPTRVLVGVNTLAPTANTHRGHCYTDDTGYNTMCINSVVSLTAGDYIVFYLLSGGLYNETGDRFNQYSIERIG